jgi:hypothetical protein
LLVFHGLKVLIILVVRVSFSVYTWQAINIGMPIIADTGSLSSDNTPHYGDWLKPHLAKPEPDPLL